MASLISGDYGDWQLDGRRVRAGDVIEMRVLDQWIKTVVRYIEEVGWRVYIPQSLEGGAGLLSVAIIGGEEARWPE